MAEGGTESLRNNLCWNQNEKRMEEKSIHEMSAFPELPISSRAQSFACMAQDRNQPELPAAHIHSGCSTTELKKPLNDAPALTPTASIEERGPEGSPQAPDEGVSSSSVVHSNSTSAFNLTASPGQRITSEQNLTSQPQPAGQTPEGTSTDIASSYLRCATSSSTPDTISMPTSPPPSSNPDSSNTNNLSAGKSPSQQPFLGAASSQLLSTGPGKVSTKDLSGGKAPPQQPMYPFPGMMGPGVPGMLPPGMMCVPIPVGFMQGGQSLMLPLSTLNGTGQHAFMHHGGMMSFPISAPMMQNIPCPPPLPTGDGGPAGNPVTVTYSNTGHLTLDSRNIPANQQGPSPPSSDENNSGGTCSYSINPGNDTRLVRLRKPILEWLRKKLDGPSQANWEALADAHGWKYDDIRAHLTECRLNQVSPFLKLLETENFYTYTINEFLKDMKQIKRLDIFLDFDSVIQNNTF